MSLLCTHPFPCCYLVVVDVDHVPKVKLCTAKMNTVLHTSTTKDLLKCCVASFCNLPATLQSACINYYCIAINCMAFHYSLLQGVMHLCTVASLEKGDDAFQIVSYSRCW